LSTDDKEGALSTPSFEIPPLVGGFNIIRAFTIVVRYFLPPLFFFVVISPGLVFAHLGHTIPPQYIILSMELLDPD